MFAHMLFKQPFIFFNYHYYYYLYLLGTVGCVVCFLPFCVDKLLSVCLTDCRGHYRFE